MFIVYRPTTDFMDSLSYNNDRLKLHRERGFETSSGIERMLAANQKMLDNGYLIPAATVECSLCDLFEKTNSITSVWTDNPEVTLLGNSVRLTSTSVGDVFEDSDGQFYIVTCFDITIANLVHNTLI